ncbi:PUA-like domain-containing protein, partial [Podospora appendiculata]
TYWLLKAEPQTRLENGIDVAFSIDDLAAKTAPEPWDGIRAYAARNNLRAMKKGDLAFFYHSNCKEPGIVGTMEIVREHSVDESAHDPKAPYYDPKSSPDNPRWSVVHVEFRSKFADIVPLTYLRAMGAPGLPLENMQMLKQSRLSVSKVSADEWEFILRKQRADADCGEEGRKA